MLCPSCDNTQLVMSDRQGVEIDYCPKCRGVWLDRGELDKILERATVELASSNGRQAAAMDGSHGRGHHGDDRHGGKHGYGSRRKSFWSEIFD